MGKERGDKKGKRHTKNSGKWRILLNFGKTESLGHAKVCGEKKNEKGGGGRGLRPKMAH